MEKYQQVIGLAWSKCMENSNIKLGLTCMETIVITLGLACFMALNHIKIPLACFMEIYPITIGLAWGMLIIIF